MKTLVQDYVSSSLAFCEQSRAMTKISEDEREAIRATLTDAIELTRCKLLRHDYSDMLETADELLQAHGLSLTTRSPGYNRLCRELLLAREGLLLTELDRNDGNYWGEHLSTSVLASKFGQQDGATTSRLIASSHFLPGNPRNL